MSASSPPLGVACAWIAVVALALGAALTVHGFLSLAAPLQSHDGHLRLLIGATAVIAAGGALLGRWRRVPPLQLGLSVLLPLAAALGHLGAVLTVTVIAFAATVLGGLLIGAGRADRHVGLSLLVGLVVYGTVVGLCVHLPINYPALHAALLALPVCAAPRRGRQLCGAAARWVGSTRGTGWPRLLLQSAVTALLLVLFLVALMPERGHDALSTHLVPPAQVAWSHRWDFDVDTYVWAVMPLLADWLYTLAYLFGGEVAARLVNFGGVALVALLVRDLARHAAGDGEGRGSAGDLAALLFLSTPLTLAVGSSLFIDAVWTAFVAGGTSCLLRVVHGDVAPDEGARRERRTLLRAAGVLLGGALAAKAVTFMVLPALVLLLAVGWRRWLRQDLAAALLAGGVACVAIGVVPYARAWLLTGNPVFPFFNGTFRSPHYPPVDFAPPAIFDKGMSWDVLHRITFDSPRFLEGHPGAAGFQWLLLFGPALLTFAAARHRRGLTLCLLAALAAWFTFRQTAYLRYVLPSFALAAAAAAAFVVWLWPRRGLLRGLAASALLAAVVLNLIAWPTAGHTHELRWSAIASEAGRDRHLLQRQPTRNAIEIVNQLNRDALPVALFGRAFAAGLRAKALIPNWYNWRFQQEVFAARSVDALGQLLGARGVRYALLADYWQDAAARDLVRGCCREVRRVADVVVLELDERFRFVDEALREPQFGSAEAWQLDSGARPEPGGGVFVPVGGWLAQQVDVVAGRAYRVELRTRGAVSDAAPWSRLQIVWLDGNGRSCRHDLEFFECGAASPAPREFVAPAKAVAARLVVSAHDADIVCEQLSFRR